VSGGDDSPAAGTTGLGLTPPKPERADTPDTAAGGLRRVVVYGRWPLVAMAATVALQSGERQSLSEAVNGIQHQFHVSDSVVGFLPFAMALVGVVGALPFGYLADRMRRAILLAGGVAVWTVCMALDAVAGTYLLLFVFRLGIGAMEANSPAAISLLSDYYPALERAKNMGLYQAGALVGAIVGLAAGGLAVSLGGWRWAFIMWVPLGVATVFFVARQPEPVRGCQDDSWEPPPATVEAATALGLDTLNRLPPPGRTATCDYATATNREVLRELLAARSMWYGVMALTVSQLLLNGLQFWAVPYFERVDGLGSLGASAVAAPLALGAVVGILGGGYLADHLLRGGMTNARVFVVAFGSIAATIVLLPAFVITNLWVTAPLLLLGGIVVTLPVAPAEALMTDVVVAEFRGRAAGIRAIVRSLSSAGPAVIGVTSTTLISRLAIDRADGLRWAIVALTPIYAIGGVLMLLAARYYPADVAFVAAESRRKAGGDE